MNHHRRRLRRGIPLLVAALALGSTSPAGSGPPPPHHPRVDANLAGAAGMVEVEIFGRNAVSPAAALAGLGARNVIARGDVVFATLPAAALETLAGHPLVAWVRPASRPVLDAVTGQGVGVTEADTWHGFGVTGAGVEVAVIDAGFAGYTNRQASGDLPGSLTTVNHCSDGFSGSEHGTAVAEIVHEMAPAAALHLICVDSSADVASAVDYAETNGVRVITQSLSWYPPGRGDGSGVFAPILADAADSGIVWVNSAGNEARNHWGGAFKDLDSDGRHEFDSGTGSTSERTDFLLAENEGVYVVLRWDEWLTTSNDFSVRLYLTADNSLVYASPDPQTGSQPPLDWFFFVNDEYPDNTSFYVRIEEVSATSTPILDLFITSNDTLNPSNSGRSVTDPASSPLVIAAGAAYWLDGDLESFSSRGPTIAGVLKPDITGPDDVLSATYGSFAGTSASAPHVAGALALLLDAAPCLDRDQVEALLTSLAIDRGIAGPDNAYGHGLLHLGDPVQVADTTGCVLRRSGPNRYATAAAISAAQFAAGADTVFIATGLGFADGLAGAAVAARLGAPLLLTDKTNLPPDTAAELDRLDPDTIVVLGGSGVVADSVLTELAPYATTVTRVSGGNRYETAVAISQYGFPTPPAGTVFVATGLNFPDALAAGAAAAALDGTVLLVPGTSLPDSVAAEIVRLDPDTIVVVGGTTAVSDAVLWAIDALQGDDTVVRISGNDRYVTATNLSAYAFPDGADGAFVATGLNFPDALAGAAAAGTAGWPVLLIPGAVVPGTVQGEIDRLGAGTLLVLGGSSVVTAAAERALEDGLG